MPEKRTARVILFKPSGKYYTEEQWEIPTFEVALASNFADIKLKLGYTLGNIRGDLMLPYGMRYSPDFHRIGNGGSVLVETQEPWGYPHLFPGREAEVEEAQE